MHQINLLADPSNPICVNNNNPSPKMTTPSPGTVSAPASASSLQANAFDFDTTSTTPQNNDTSQMLVTSTTKLPQSHVKNLTNAMVLTPKLNIPMPSTSNSGTGFAVQQPLVDGGHLGMVTNMASGIQFKNSNNATPGVFNTNLKASSKNHLLTSSLLIDSGQLAGNSMVSPLNGSSNSTNNSMLFSTIYNNSPSAIQQPPTMTAISTPLTNNTGTFKGYHPHHHHYQLHPTTVAITTTTNLNNASFHQQQQQLHPQQQSSSSVVVGGGGYHLMAAQQPQPLYNNHLQHHHHHHQQHNHVPHHQMANAQQQQQQQQYYQTATDILNLTDSGIDRTANLSTNSSIHNHSLQQSPMQQQLTTSTPSPLVGLSVVVAPTTAEIIPQKQPNHSKMTEILKRKVPPKRKSQGGNRSKTRQDDQSQPSSSSSVMQELINKATTLGSSSSSRHSAPSSSGSNANSNSTPKSRFGGPTSKTTSFLASLNPARWGRHASTSSSHSTFTKESSSSNALSKCPSNSNLIAAGNREKARQWIRDQAVMFIGRHEQNSGSGVGHSANNILNRLAGNFYYKIDVFFKISFQDLMQLNRIFKYKKPESAG